MAEPQSQDSIRSGGDRALLRRLRQVNLDLLPILHALLSTRSVTGTARHFGISQPAVSRALRQLREHFRDELLIQAGGEARLTRRAETLVEPLQQALRAMDALLAPTEPFDPAGEAAHFSIVTADYISLLLSPLLAEICAAEAPGVTIDFKDAGAITGGEGLARVDFLIAPRGFAETLDRRIGTLPLWHDEMVCIAAARNTDLPARIGPEEFRRSRHVGFLQSERLPEKTRALLQPTAPLETGSFCKVRNFLVIGAISERADCLALVPRRVARELLKSQALRIIELDYEPKDLFIDTHWSLAVEGKRGHAWFRDLLVRIAGMLD